MSFNSKSFDDDEDLEILRIAALKSLPHKKEANHSPRGKGNVIQVVNHGHNANNISPIKPINVIDTYAVHPVPEPYIPQSTPATIQPLDSWNSAKTYIPAYPVIPPPVVDMAPITSTLSPRSLEFVKRNNDILLRRKIEKSPRSPSPESFHDDPMRWSESPPPMHRSASRKRRVTPPYRRSLSPRRSHSRSPVPKKYSKSPAPRSPKQKSKSPYHQRAQPKWRKFSRSPNPKRARTKSRSPPSQAKYGASKSGSGVQYRRQSNSPVPRHNGNRGNNLDRSPRRNRQFNRSPVHHRTNSPLSNARITKRRSNTPINRKPFKRSRSRSKITRRPSRDRDYNNKNDRTTANDDKYNRRRNDRRNNDHTKDNFTRHTYNKNRSISKSPVTQVKEVTTTTAANTPENKPPAISTKGSGEKDIAFPPDMMSAIQNEKNNEETNSLSPNQSEETEKDSSDDDENGDEIDLFASEESESENEGRFKSSSSSAAKCDTGKKAPVLSFLKLGNATSTSIGELKEAPTMTSRDDKNGRNYSSMKDSDRDRKYNNRRKPFRSDRKYRNSPFSRDSNKDNDDDHSKKVVSSSAASKFRSTFQTVENGVSSADKASEITTKLDSKPGTTTESGKRNTIILKKSITSLIKSEVDASSSSTITGTKKSTDSVSTGAAASTVKKPIHLRLGAASNSSSKSSSSSSSTWNSNNSKIKKSWRFEKV